MTASPTTTPSAAPSATPAATPRPSSPPTPGWVPVRTLSARHRPRILAHLTGLSARDRYLRFGYAATEEQIERYVGGIDFERDQVFGVFNRRLELIAAAHLAHMPPAADTERRTAEFGVSVAAKVRGRGFGAHLFRHAMRHARNRRVDTLFIHALSENVAMLKIARRAGAVVERDGAESQAWLRLPPDDLASQLDEMVDGQAAEMNYRWKVQAHRLGEMLGVWLDVKARTRRTKPFDRLL